jgi:hypothetical protein
MALRRRSTASHKKVNPSLANRSPVFRARTIMLLTGSVAAAINRSDSADSSMQELTRVPVELYGIK